MNAGRITLLVFAIIFIIVSIAMVIGGAFILVFDSGFKDKEGFYATGSVPLSSTSNAIITYPSDFKNDPNISNDYPGFPGTVTLKVEAINTDSSKPIFIGIAQESDITSYLNGVSYDKFEGFSSKPYKVHLNHVDGSGVPSDPTKQKIWLASASGTGLQTLKWDMVDGSNSLILMNADGSSPVDAKVSVGIKIPEIFHAVGVALLVGGIVLLITSCVMIYFSLHGRKSSKQPAK